VREERACGRFVAKPVYAATVTDEPEVDDGDPVFDVPRMAYGIGLLAGAIGVIDGGVLLFKREDAACNEDAYTAGPGCFVNPQAAEGIALIVVSVMLMALIVLVWSVLQSRVRKT
jgi:hypothetical protein